MIATFLFWNGNDLKDIPSHLRYLTPYLLVLSLASILPVVSFVSVDIFVEHHGGRFDFLAPCMSVLSCRLGGLCQCWRS